MDEPKEVQYKSFSLYNLATSYLKGLILVRDHIIYWLEGLVNFFFATRRPERDAEKGPQSQVGLAEDSVSLAYGFTILSRVSNLALDWVTSFMFDIRPGVYPSPLFIRTHYVIVIFGGLLGFPIAYVVMYPSITALSSLFPPELANLTSNMATISEVAFLLSGLGPVTYLIYNQRFVQDFMLYSLSNISLSKEFQKRTVVTVFLSHLTFATLSEPFFMVLSWIQNFNQPTYLAHLSRAQFMTVKTSVAIFSYLGSTLVCMLGSYIPMVTNIMICSIAEHTRLLTDKQVSRYGKVVANHHPDPEFEKILPGNQLVREVSENFGVLTLAMDWPQLNDSTSPADQVSCSETDPSLPLVKDKKQRDITFVGMLFLYKSLTKSLGELKVIIGIYERHFGHFHSALVLLRGIIVAQWVTAAYIYTKMMALSSERVINELASSEWVTPWTIQISISLLVFCVDQSVTFYRLDCLPQQMIRLRNKLLQLNIQLSELADDRVRGISSSEMNIIWSHYDQLARLTRKVCFRFHGRTLYGKNCLISILAREISMTLLYIQLIDMYTVAVSAKEG